MRRVYRVRVSDVVSVSLLTTYSVIPATLYGAVALLEDVVANGIFDNGRSICLNKNLTTTLSVNPDLSTADLDLTLAEVDVSPRFAVTHGRSHAPDMRS